MDKILDLIQEQINPCTNLLNWLKGYYAGQDSFMGNSGMFTAIQLKAFDTLLELIEKKITNEQKENIISNNNENKSC